MCPYGCRNTTTGTFHLGNNPMTFDGTGKFEFLDSSGGALCDVTYDISGTRTSCATGASSAGRIREGWEVFSNVPGTSEECLARGSSSAGCLVFSTFDLLPCLM